MSRHRARAEADLFLEWGLEFDPVVYAGRSLQGGTSFSFGIDAVSCQSVFHSPFVNSSHPLERTAREHRLTARTVHGRATKAKVLEIFPEHRSSSPSRKHRFTHTPQSHHASIASIHHSVESTSQPILLARSENVPLPPHKAGPTTGAVLFLGAWPTAAI
jgi:hypothetical protein